jgi:hypothetical protein
MSDDIPDNEINRIKQSMEGYINDFDKIDHEISNMIKDSNKTLEDYDSKTQSKIMKGRDKALSIGYTAIATISILIRRFRTASKLSDLFIQLVNRFVSLITKYVKVFKIDSIQVTIGLAPSIVVSFKP